MGPVIAFADNHKSEQTVAVYHQFSDDACTTAMTGDDATYTAAADESCKEGWKIKCDADGNIEIHMFEEEDDTCETACTAATCDGMAATLTVGDTCVKTE